MDKEVLFEVVKLVENEDPTTAVERGKKFKLQLELLALYIVSVNEVPTKGGLTSAIFQSADTGIYQGVFKYDVNAAGAGHSRVADRTKFEERRERMLKFFMVNENNKTKSPNIYFRIGNKYEGMLEPNISTEDKIQLNSFKLGTIVDLNTFVDHFNSEDKTESGLHIAKGEDLFAVFSHGKQKIRMEFRLTSGTQKGGKKMAIQSFLYRMQMDYNSISHVVVTPVQRDGNRRNNLLVHIVMKSPPLLYHKGEWLGEDRNIQKRPHGSEAIHADELTLSKSWKREQNFDLISTEAYGKCNVLCLSMDMISNSKDYRVQIGRIVDPWALISCLNLMLDTPIYFAPMTTIDAKSFSGGAISIPKVVPFQVGYALQGLLTFSFQVEDELKLKNQRSRFKKIIEKCSKESPKDLEETLFDAFRALSRGSVIRFLEFVERTYQEKRSHSLRSTRGDPFDMEHVRRLRRVILTPTRLIFMPPDPFLMSRFLRNSSSDYCLRLSIRDDNDQSLLYTAMRKGGKHENELFLKETIKDPILNGIKVYGRSYEFLASSASQLRQHGMILYAEDDKGRTAAQMRSGIGHLDKIDCVSKYITRMGHAFSQAQANIDVPRAKVILDYPDIYGSKHPQSGEPFTFTDGVGKISIDLARKAASALGYKIVPSTFQIRYAGAKGVVVIDPTIKSGEKELYIRESMNKFESESTSLELLKVSAPRQLYLNKSFINILNQLEVPREVILNLQLRVLNKLTNAFIQESEAAAIIKNYTTIGSILPIDSLSESGINILHEAFFRMSLDTVIRRVVTEIRTKARIKLPADAARSMFGVADETNTLKPGEIFVQYSDMNDLTKRFILEGDVLVTKSPSMITGDVRKFKAKNVKALRHICDSIVFPAPRTGVGRPHPNEMAGSDLDGDEYAVIWYKPLLFAGENRSAMIFPEYKAKKGEKTSVPAIMDFFISHIQKDSVGLIANAHLARADRDIEGNDPICMKLAEKYARALDAGKTGKYESLERNERPFLYPDFMEKTSMKPSYPSNRILGELYRQVSMYELCIQEEVAADVRGEVNPLLVHPDFEKYRLSAKKSFEKYRGFIEGLLTQFGIEDEASLLTQAFLSKDNMAKSADAQTLVDVLMRNIFKKMKEDFYDEFVSAEKEGSPQNFAERKMAKASAWYVISYDMNKNESKPICALPWIVADQLALMAKSRRDIRPSDQVTPSRLTFEDAINLLDAALVGRQEKTLEGQIEVTQEVMSKWLYGQNHLKLSQHTSAIMLKNKINEVLHGLFNRLRFEKDQHSIPTAGRMALATLLSLTKPVFDIAQRNDEEENQAQLDSLRFTSLLAISRLFRTRNPNCIVIRDAPPPLPLSVQSFYFHMNRKNGMYDIVIRHEREFMKIMEELSGVDMLAGHFDLLAKDNYYLRINALGTKWNLNLLRHQMTHHRWFHTLKTRTNEYPERPAPYGDRSHQNQNAGHQQAPRGRGSSNCRPNQCRGQPRGRR